MVDGKSPRSTSRNAAALRRPPTGWVYLSAGDAGYTIRWQRGDHVAYVFAGEQMTTYPDKPLTVPVLATIPVPSSGWTDLAQIRFVGERWLRTKTELRE